MAEFKALLQSYGADYQTTIDRFMGREAMYLRFLNMLPGDGSFQQLGAALDAGDLTAAFGAAHTLKGVSGNLGLTPLYQAVCAIVEPLRIRQERDYGALYGAVRAEYERAIRLLEELKGGV